MKQESVGIVREYYHSLTMNPLALAGRRMSMYNKSLTNPFFFKKKAIYCVLHLGYSFKDIILVMTKFITHEQLKIARHISNLSVRDLAKILNVSKATISNVELGKTKTFLYKYSPALINIFNVNKIIFPNEFSIRYMSDTTNVFNQCDLLTRFQLKAARHLLSINTRRLAKIIQIGSYELSIAEALENDKYVLENRPQKNKQLKEFFLSKKILFPDALFIFFKNI